MQDLTIRGLLRQFVHLGLAHVSGWKVMPGARFQVPIFIAGTGEHATKIMKSGKVAASQYGTDEAPRLNAEMIFFASAIRALESQCHNGLTLAEATGAMHGTALRLLRHMYAIRLIHIEEWQVRNRGGAQCPLYRLGQRQDAKRPVAKPKIEVFQLCAKDRYARRKAMRLNHIMAGNSAQFRKSA